MTTAEKGIFAATSGSSLSSAELLLRTPQPDISESEAEALALRHYGRNGKARLLSGERDRNFLIGEADGRAAVLKFYNAAEDAPTRALQHGALDHVHAHEPACPVPQIQLSLDGREEMIVEVRGADTAMAMISLLPGVNPAAEDISPRLRSDIGRVVGLLSRALAGYDHPSATRAILWDMMLVAELSPLADLVQERGRRASMERWLRHFADDIRPAAAGLPQQVIHNDLSLSNILVDPGHRDRVTGVIDFGDIVRAPRINEFAIAASYFITPAADPMASVAEVLRGAGGSLTFRRDEVMLVPDLMRARLVTRILLSEWRAQLFPANHAYIMRSNRAAWNMWECLETESAGMQSRRLLSLADEVVS